MRSLRFLGLTLAGLALVGVAAATWWRGVDSPPPRPAESAMAKGSSEAELAQILLSDQAIENLGLIAKPVRPDLFWRTIEVPGTIVDLPGRSDRRIVATASGVVASIHHFAGDVVRPGDILMTLRLLSESLHTTQANLFKAEQELRLTRAQRERLTAMSGAIPEARIIETENQLARLQVSIKAYQQELLSRGLSADQVASVAAGTFVRDIEIRVPGSPHASASTSASPKAGPELTQFEVQDVSVDLGQQVQAGAALCVLADHERLVIEGEAFRDEAPLIERSVVHHWPVAVDFQEKDQTTWPPLPREFFIDYVANEIDPQTRTFSFRVPLVNQRRQVDRNGSPLNLWRFRPGQKVRLRIRTEPMENVFALPSAAVVSEGAEAFVFTQNVNTFVRRRVRLLYRDRDRAVLANDGSLIPGSFVVDNVAAALNRMTKASSGEAPKGYHIHADGSLHRNEDEGN